MEPVSSEITAYAELFTSQERELRAELLALSMAHPHANMVSGRLQGRLLEMLSRMIAPERILEVGTFTGYSALCLAEGLTKDGELHTIELRDDDADTAESFFKRSAFASRIILHRGNALEVIPSLQQVWDMVFIDADKTGYEAYYELAIERLKPGGWLLADNVLFHGQVLESPPKGKNARAIHAFNEKVAADERVEHVLLTVRDGLMLVRKK